MSIKVTKKIPTGDEIIRNSPLSLKAQEQVDRDRQEVKDILSGKNKRLLVIVGPCSAWPYEAVLQYVQKLKNLSDKVSERLKLILRLYIQKPRTTKGWTGPINQPDPFLPPDIEKGIEYCRKLMVEVVEMGIPIADEAVFTHNANGFIELLSWVVIGARSTEDQEHRIFASMVDCAAGMKNPTSGSIEIGINSVIAAQHAHTFVLNGYQVETTGNPYAHLVLRGGFLTGPNYYAENLFQAKELLEKNKVLNPAVIIDASHDNSVVDNKKDPKRQIKVVDDVIKILKENLELKSIVKGFMLESFLKEGNQKLDNLTSETVDRNGLSVTDACLGWQETEQLLLKLAKIN